MSRDDGRDVALNLTHNPHPRLALGLLIMALIVAGCGLKVRAVEGMPGMPGARLAEAAVRRTYEALAGGDRGRYAASLEPAARPGAYPTSALSVAAGLFALPEATRTQLSLEDMTYTATRSDGTWAEVHVRGVVRNAALNTATPIDAIEIAHRVNGRWYTTLPELYRSTPAGQDYAARLRKLDAEGCH